MTTHDVAANDVVLSKSLTKICKLRVFGFFSCSSVAKGERLFACRSKTHKESEWISYNFRLQIQICIQLWHSSTCQAVCCCGWLTTRFWPRGGPVHYWGGVSLESLQKSTETTETTLWRDIPINRDTRRSGLHHKYLHLIAHTAAGNAVWCSRSSPQVRKPLDGQRVTIVSVPGHFEVQVTIVWKTSY